MGKKLSQGPQATLLTQEAVLSKEKLEQSNSLVPKIVFKGDN